MIKLKHIAYGCCLAATIVACGNAGKQSASNEKAASLKEKFSQHFLMGAALNQRQVAGYDSLGAAIAKQHFNAIVAENCMKSEVIHPEEGTYNFVPADSLVSFGEQNGMKVIGHCLIWHSQLAPWFCVDKDGRNVSPDVLKQRIKEHITTIVGRYKGRIHGWDVVNEAIIEDGSYRQTKFYEILGEEYIPFAFECAHEADPEAELYYNDYGMNVPGRRDAVVALVKSLKEKGIRIDAVGMQGHMGMDYPTLNDFEQSIEAFAATGAKVMITEWDMSALPTVSRTANIADTAAYQKALDPYPEALPDSISQQWNQRMMDFFQLFLKHSDVITRVTAWGISDGDSWKNDFPVPGRHEYPLLFDRHHQPKPFVSELLEMPETTTTNQTNH